MISQHGNTGRSFIKFCDCAEPISWTTIPISERCTCIYECIQVTHVAVYSTRLFVCLTIRTTKFYCIRNVREGLSSGAQGLGRGRQALVNHPTPHTCRVSSFLYSNLARRVAARVRLVRSDNPVVECGNGCCHGRPTRGTHKPGQICRFLARRVAGRVRLGRQDNPSVGCD